MLSRKPFSRPSATLCLRRSAATSTAHKLVFALLSAASLSVIFLCYAGHVFGGSVSVAIGSVYPGAPAYMDAAYRFDGNATSIQGRPSDPAAMFVNIPHGLLIRQPDCSLNGYVLSAYSMLTAFTSSIASPTLAHYDRHLHDLAGLTTTPGTFPRGCQEPVLGVHSSGFAVLGKTSSGKFITAFYDQNSSNDALSTALVDPAGSYSYNTTTITGVFGLNVADLNGDGTNDLIISSLLTGGSVSVQTMLSNGDGTFAAPVALSAGGISSVVADDYNGDGKVDIAVTVRSGAAPGALRLYPGKGDGTFGSPILSTIPQSLQGNIAAATGDFNNDGKKDIVLGTAIAVGAGDGTFTFQTTNLPGGIPVVADFNNDGKADVAAFLNGGVTIYLGNSDFTFTVGQSYSGIYNSFSGVSTDIDGDGNADIVFGDGSNGVFKGTGLANGVFSVLMGRGDGTFVGAPLQSSVIESGGQRPFALGDFNGDGKLDLLGAAPGTGVVSTGLVLLTGDGKGGLNPQTPNRSVTPTDVFTADVDGDHKLDALVLTSDPSVPNVALQVLKGAGDGTFQTPVVYPLIFPPVVASGLYPATDATFADLRGTGKPDALVSIESILYLLKNNGDGTFSAATPISDQTTAQLLFERIVTVDLNGDGKPDLLADVNGNTFPYTNLQTFIYINKGDGTFFPPVAYANGGYSAVADVNKDGKPDLLVAGNDTNNGNTTLSTLLGLGDGTFGSPQVSNLLGLAVGPIAIADADGDGNPDVLLSGCCRSTSLALGHGDGTFSANYAFSFGAQSSQVAFADLNNDGRPDLVIAAGAGLVTSINRYGLALPGTTTSITSVSASPNPATAGQTVTLTATVSGTGGTPTGTVTFVDGTTVLGTGSLASGTASSTTSTLTAGTHSIAAVYSGDSTFATSTSSAISLTVNSPQVATTTTVTASANPIVAGAAETFTATVTQASGTTIPTGMVTFADGMTSLGAVTLDTTGKAALSLSALAAGTHTIQATYAGATAFSTSASPALTLTVTAPVAADFSLTLSPASATVTSGLAASSTLTLTPIGGLKTATTLTCAGAPSHASCTFASTSLTSSDGTAPATTTVTISTNVQTASITSAANLYQLAAILPLGLLCSILLPFALRRRTRWPMHLTLFVAVCTLLAASGCGGKSTTPVTTTNVAPGTYPMTITGTNAAITHSATFTVIVQ